MIDIGILSYQKFKYLIYNKCNSLDDQNDSKTEKMDYMDNVKIQAELK